MAPQRSMQTTSIGELVRLGKKLWCYSSKMAIKSVHDAARKAHAAKWDDTCGSYGVMSEASHREGYADTSIADEVTSLTDKVVHFFPVPRTDRAEQARPQRIELPTGVSADMVVVDSATISSTGCLFLQATPSSAF